MTRISNPWNTYNVPTGVGKAPGYVIAREEGGAYEWLEFDEWIKHVDSATPIVGVWNGETITFYDRILERLGSKAWRYLEWPQKPPEPSETPATNLRVIYETNFRDVPATLRAIADQIEAGDFGAVSQCAVVALGDTCEVFGLGPGCEGDSIALLLQAGAMRMIEQVANHGRGGS